jgi:hypothetical protein
MPIFGSKIGIALGGSGSFELPTTSSLEAISFIYSPATSSNPFVTSSIASIEANIINADQTGSSGELLFRVASPEDNVSKGEIILKVGATGSNNEPRVGIGFGEDEKPIKSFEVKTKKDSTEGTELLLRSSRLTKGADGGDSAGSIRFSVDSASFEEITTTGSVALIDTQVTTIEAGGVTGDLIFKAANTIREAPNEIMRIRGDNNRVDITGSLRVTSNITTDTLSNVETTLTDDAITNVDTFATATYRGAIYDYVLYDNTVGARAGQFMVVHDGGSITFTDTSTKHLTDSTVPSITADINGANVRVRVTNGNGYTFKALVKKL